eukprot:7294827-Pyramimonas_sp.AAC.1
MLHFATGCGLGRRGRCTQLGASREGGGAVENDRHLTWAALGILARFDVPGGTVADTRSAQKRISKR